VELGKAFVTISADATKLTAGIAAAKGQIGNATAGMSAQFKTLGMGMAVAGAAITAAFGLTVKSAIGFQKELAQVSTMLNESAMKIMPEYKAGLQELSVQFGEATSTLSKGLYDILSASIPPAEALDVLEVAARAAAAGITDTGVAADAITTILNSYGMSADKAEEVSDKLFATVLRGKTTFAELAPSIGKSASLASIAGLSFDDLGASISTMTRAGIRVDEAMTSINGILNAFIKPAEESVAVAKQFNLTLDTNTLKTIGLTGVMEKLTDATAEQLAAIFPNIRGLKGIAAAMGDAAGYAEDYALILNSVGLTQDAFEKQSATLSFKINQLKMSFSVIATTIGDALIPVVELMVVWLGKVIGVMKKFMDAHPGLTKAIVLLGAALGVLVGAGGAIILGVLAFTKLKEALIALKVAFIVVKGAMTLLSGPIGWIILAIGALALAWTTNFGGIRDFTIAVANKIKEVLGWLWDKVIWVAEKLGLIKESAAGGGGALGAFGDEAKGAGEKAEGATTGVDNLTDSMGGLEEETDEAKIALNEFGQVIETFDEWVRRLAEETAEANEKIADEVEKAMERYENAIKPIEDRLYELSHTEEEVAARNLLTKKEQLEAIIKTAGLAADHEKKELTLIKEWYEKEIDLIKAKLVEQQNALIETARKTEESANIQKAAIKGITDEYTGLINKIDAVGKAVEAAAKKAASEAFLAGVPTIAETGYVPSYIPKLPHGTPYVPKTGLYQLHQGEAVIPKNQNTTNNSNSFSPSIVVNVSGGGNASNIAYEVKKVLDESIRQFRRSGFELVPGRG